MQRNSPERKKMLAARRAQQLARTGGGKFTPVYRTGIKWRRNLTRGPTNHIIPEIEGFRLHATKGWRRITEYERTIEHG